MDEEIKRLAKEMLKEITPELKTEIVETTKQCVGEECKRIRAEYEEASKPKKKDKLEEVNERLQAIEELFSADKDAPEEEELAPAKKGKKRAVADAIEEVEKVDCPNCGFDKSTKPKYVGHCSDEGDEVKFSEFEKSTDWKFCPHCASPIEWEDEDEE